MTRTRRSGIWIGLVTSAALAGVAGCSSSGSPGSGDAAADAASPDAGVADGRSVVASRDAAWPDGAPDSAPSDAAPPNATTWDAAPSDAAAGDAASDVSSGDAAPSDAAPDATTIDAASGDADDDGTHHTDLLIDSGTSTVDILDAAGAGCLACAELSQCIATFGTCEDFIGDPAEGGAAAGTSRLTLCLDTLACVLASACADQTTFDDLACYCGANCGSDAGGAPNGLCLTSEARGVEQSLPTAVEDSANYYNLGTGGGRANELVSCLAISSCTSCFPGE